MSGVGLDADIRARMREKYDPTLEQKALEWIAFNVGETSPKVIGKDGDVLYEWLKDGVLLCKLMNVIQPGVIPVQKIAQKPRHVLQERENINLYLRACSTIGVSSQDMCLLADLHSRKSISAVLDSIYAVGRQAQVMPTYQGPKLGVTYNVSLEEQKKRQEKKEQEKQTQGRHRRAKSEAQLTRRLVLEKDRRTEAIDDHEKKETRKLTRRLSKGRISMSDFRMKSSDNLRKFAELRQKPKIDLSSVAPEIKVAPVKYGMDLEIEQRRKRKYCSVKEEQVMDWIEAVTGEQVDDFFVDLKDGITLCKLLNCFRPALIKRINKKDRPIAHRDNLQLYLWGCTRLGVASASTFSVNDLYEQKDLSAVVNHFFTLSRQVQLLNVFSGPFLELDGSLSSPESKDISLEESNENKISQDEDNGHEYKQKLKKAPRFLVRQTRTDPGVREDKKEWESNKQDTNPGTCEAHGDTKQDQHTDSCIPEEKQEKESGGATHESLEGEGALVFTKYSYLSLFSPIFLISSLFESICCLPYCLNRG